jgi:hypothetical protein
MDIYLEDVSSKSGRWRFCKNSLIIFLIIMDYKPKQKEFLYDPGVDANGNRRDITRDVSCLCREISY